MPSIAIAASLIAAFVCLDADAPAPPRAALIGRILSTTPTSDGQEIIVNGGTEQGVTAAWTAIVLRRDSDTPLPGGAATILHVARRSTSAIVQLTAAQLSENPRVKLAPPQ